jgi:hypothetical protein
MPLHLKAPVAGASLAGCRGDQVRIAQAHVSTLTNMSTLSSILPYLQASHAPAPLPRPLPLLLSITNSANRLDKLDSWTTLRAHTRAPPPVHGQATVRYASRA